MNLAHLSITVHQRMAVTSDTTLFISELSTVQETILHCMDAYKEQNVIKLTRLAHGGHGHRGCFFLKYPHHFCLPSPRVSAQCPPYQAINILHIVLLIVGWSFYPHVM